MQHLRVQVLLEYRAQSTTAVRNANQRANQRSSLTFSSTRLLVYSSTKNLRIVKFF